MATAPKSHLTPEEYLDIERQAEFRSEYVAGEMFAMAGATSNHNRIISNVVAAVRPKLRRKFCFIYASDMKIWIPNSREFTYPDVAVVCGEPQFQDQVTDVLLNPVLIVEVLSKSTANYDRSEKFAKYREISSFQEYLLITQDRVQVDCYSRLGAQHWNYIIYTSLEETIPLKTPALELSLVDVYEDISFG